jgi:hypothetical protein
MRKRKWLGGASGSPPGFGDSPQRLCSEVGTDPNFNFFWRICGLLSVFPSHTVTATVITLIVT